MFEKLKNLIKNNKGFLIKTTILLGMYFFLSDFAFAQDAGPTPLTSGNGTEEKIKNKVIAVMVTISTTLSVLLGLLTYLVTMFLSPEWITGNIFNIGDKLKDIWILISNVVYFAFAFILIYIAFMNIVGAGGNDYEFKSALPKFIVGILIVPFSWFLVNFLVTLSSILTIAALNLPFDTFKDYKTGLEQVNIPSKCILNLNALSSEGNTNGTEGNTQNGVTTNEIFDCPSSDKEGKKIPKVKLSEIFGTDNSAESIFGIISLYTYGLVELESITELNEKSLKGTIKTIGDVVTKVLFDMVFVIAYGLLMIALGLALMIRGIWLWIYMMLSPLFGLMYFFGKGKDGFFKNFNFTEFLHLCLVPVYTMLALSFGMLFIYTVGTGISEKNTTSLNDSIKINSDGQEITVNEKFTLQIQGPVSGATVNNEEIKTILGTIGNGALGIVGALILKLFGIVVLWGTVMMALSKSEITKSIVEPIAQFGEGVGKTLTSIPQYTPILPGGQSLKSLERIPGLYNSALERQASDATTRASKLLGIEKSEWRNMLEDFKNSGKTTDVGEQYKLYTKMLEMMKGKNISELLKDSDFKQLANTVGSFNDVKMNFSNEQALKQSLAQINTKYSSGIDGYKSDYSTPIGIDTFLKNSDSVTPTPEIPKVSLNSGKFTQEFKINLGNGEQTISKGNNIQNVVNIIPDTGIDGDTLRKKLKQANLDDSTIEEIIKQAGDKIKKSQNLPNS